MELEGYLKKLLNILLTLLKDYSVEEVDTMLQQAKEITKWRNNHGK